MNLKAIYVLFAILLAGLSYPSAGQGRISSPDTMQLDLPSAFDTILRAYEVGWTSEDASALAELFSEDGFVLRPGHPPVRGRAAIRKAYSNSGGPLILRAYGYGMDDTVGYIVGGFAREPGDPDVGKFVLALRRDTTGKWLIAADIDNGNSR